MTDRVEAAFAAFVSARSPALLRTAYLLTGDRGHAEDLLQTALLKTFRHWDRIRHQDRPEAFVRKVMVNSQRMVWRRRAVLEHVAIWQVLARLPPRMRAVLVLRYWEDLSEKETAEVLGCSVGTVKSQASRGLTRLRTVVRRDADVIQGGRP
jgi:DNA-directed RNA polymerase specialized sigma24 family protein